MANLLSVLHFILYQLSILHILYLPYTCNINYINLMYISKVILYIHIPCTTCTTSICLPLRCSHIV